MDGRFNQEIDFFKDLLLNAKHAVVFTGAGISTPSGIPDFRSPNTGLWEKEDPMEVISLTVFKSDPTRFFNWLHPLLITKRNAKPNIAHTTIAKLQQKGIIKSVITQNIDLLHQEAGSTDVITLHGTLGTYTCLNCGNKVSEDEPVIRAYVESKVYPKCDQCQAYLKPDIVFFEEMLPHWEWRKANNEAFKSDLMIAIGSSLMVHPANQIPNFAYQNGSKVVINTLSTTPLDHISRLTLNYDIKAVWEAIESLI